jgi:transcriptional regulator with GAF, ATPase, and Fis domain
LRGRRWLAGANVDKFLDYEACFMNPQPEGRFGVSEAMRQVEMLLRRVADVDSPLLITGESGVDKEVAARFAHRISTRTAEPFVTVNCGAIPNDLIESQLFGHERGAFTSAQARHHGYVERARSGILFLDEVGELPMLMQVKLLRLIRDRVFTRVGGETAIKTDHLRDQYRLGGRRHRGPFPQGSLRSDRRDPHRHPASSRSAE